jgi:hypothetical protein
VKVEGGSGKGGEVLGKVGEAIGKVRECPWKAVKAVEAVR